MKHWNTSGIRTSLSEGRKKEAPSSDSTFRIGSIPFVDRFIANQRIRGREQAISKIGKKIEAMITKEKQKVESVIDFARRTDIRTVYERALALRDRLEEAACVDLDFKRVAEGDAVEPAKPGRPPKPKPPKPEPLNILCVKAIAKALFDKKTTGMVTGRGADQKFKRIDLNPILDKCVQQGGKLKIPAELVDSLTAGAKKVELEINATEG